MARTGSKPADKPTVKEAEERIENGLALPRRPDRRALPGGDRHQRGSFRLHVILDAAARAAGAQRLLPSGLVVKEGAEGGGVAVGGSRAACARRAAALRTRG
jgi:hypothetical protein